jgi:hypothetical protein
MMQQDSGVPPDSRLSVSFTALSEWIGASGAWEWPRLVSARRCPAAIFIQHNGFEAINGTAVRLANDWHTNCFKKARKEKANEDQDEFEGGHNLYVRQLAGGVYAAKARRVNLVSDYRMARRLAINRERSKVMKTKTNLKTGYIGETEKNRQ